MTPSARAAAYALEHGLPLIDCSMTTADLMAATKSVNIDTPISPAPDGSQSWKLVVYITGTQVEAEYIREEVVGACEDAQESERISASVGDLEPDE